MSSTSGLEASLVPGTLCSCATILVYDWICTLDQEITHVWTRRWSTGTLFFVVNRYLPFIDIFIALSAKFTRISPETCLTRNKIVAWLSLLGILVSEVILMLRTFALWERKRAVSISFMILTICTAVPIIALVQLELESLEYVSTADLGCTLAKASSIIIFAYILLMISETVIVILTAVKAYRDLRRSRQPWLVQLYRDGMLFYVYLFGISIANILVPILAPSMFSNWLTPNVSCTPFCAHECFSSSALSLSAFIASRTPWQLG
ncbi:hypothetical protein B0H19DRAFT_1253375 [Mycena capillaripes]|nr:hypothetical protein B0H19DRAFT_1253375 [Mycena capillaripes]